MLELLQCLQLSGAKVISSQNLSNILFILYLISFFLNRKCAYIGAFLFLEFIGYSSLLEWCNDITFYLFLGSAFSLCYWYEVLIGKNIRIIFAYGIMVLFQLAMSLDAYIYPDIKTLIYYSYEYIILAIHLYIIITLIRWKTLRRVMGDISHSVANFLNIGYAFAFCYNAYILHNKK